MTSGKDIMIYFSLNGEFLESRCPMGTNLGKLLERDPRLKECNLEVGRYDPRERSATNKKKVSLDYVLKNGDVIVTSEGLR